VGLAGFGALRSDSARVVAWPGGRTAPWGSCLLEPPQDVSPGGGEGCTGC
jgi:hypothetical protein